jgi:NAD-dependent dihydropyrimidine dehydrogenase PreA subunit
MHGAGKKWYYNARNFSKELATSDLVRDFCEGYFSEDIVPSSWNPKEYLSRPIKDGETEKVKSYYLKYFHHQVITTEEAFQVIKLASTQTEDSERTVVRLPCICRYAGYGSDPDLACYGIAFTDEYTKRFPKYLGGGHQYVSPDEAIEHLEKMIAEKPIVHAIAALGVPYLGMLCNCDMKVCQPYMRRLRLGIDAPFHKGHFVAEIDEQKCVSCGTCESVCPFKVPTLPNDSSVAVIDNEACFGCGVCVQNCPEGAISLILASRKTGF